ncbi:hypothetical protein F4810DRAFT_465673 [Camillea tinctor]|nr:hypothetical protein F4810DRAFT_465673 [Camillea tinctor]
MSASLMILFLGGTSSSWKHAIVVNCVLLVFLCAILLSCCITVSLRVSTKAGAKSLHPSVRTTLFAKIAKALVAADNSCKELELS